MSFTSTNSSLPGDRIKASHLVTNPSSSLPVVRMNSSTSLYNVLLIKVISPALRDNPDLGTGEIARLFCDLLVGYSSRLEMDFG
jgi:hypothetical protein